LLQKPTANPIKPNATASSDMTATSATIGTSICGSKGPSTTGKMASISRNKTNEARLETTAAQSVKPLTKTTFAASTFFRGAGQETVSTRNAASEMTAARLANPV
jgi:hypothetical protein